MFCCPPIHNERGFKVPLDFCAIEEPLLRFSIYLACQAETLIIALDVRVRLDQSIAEVIEAGRRLASL